MNEHITSKQAAKAVSMLHQRGMVRLSEFMSDGITAATISRLERQGSIVRLSRGLYQLPDAPLDAHHALAEASKLVPRGVVCLVSALAFHDLTDQVPPKIWMAIGAKDWKPRVTYPPLHFSRFPDQQLKSGVEIHHIEGTPVRIFGVAKTLADVFRYRRTVGTNLAIEGLRAAIKQRKASPSEIAAQAAAAGVWKAMQPYLETLTFDG
ncbi:type IV toxin-antitoxin system AbiEi family antitoxin domain-containing protein [Nevskia soli]|uniref:type IV toxin-antitoxin system AbiEi family antitoxin domain-containing protein n=1 Tax=Nevskia soli TaxID=418856 RepID=UPI0004A71E16|nr:type IV toxin-antitoxin system AbiEi family antitoxin domain-containing protein [Nevskia soli]